MTDMLEPMTLQQEIDAMRARLNQSPSGSYYIPGIKFSDRNPTVASLHLLMSRLSLYFPEYVWSTHDSWFPEETGVRVEWNLKPEALREHIREQMIEYKKENY